MLSSHEIQFLALMEKWTNYEYSICSLDTGHISLYGAIQSLKHGSLTDEDFKTTIDHFNAV